MLLDKIKQLEILDDRARFETILNWLQNEGIAYQLHRYTSGENILVKSNKINKIGIGSHFDTVIGCPGANDNASAVVVCFELCKRFYANPLKNIGVDFFFFDEEERGLIGSSAYLKKYGLDGMVGYLNLEMVGMGNQLATWPVNELSSGKLLEAFEESSSKSGVSCGRYDRIVMNTADHESFRIYGLKDSFSVTCISDKDVEVAYHYYKAMEFDVDANTLYEIMSAAPLFKHYHQSTDKSEFLSEDSLQMTVNVIWQTLQSLDQKNS